MIGRSAITSVVDSQPSAVIVLLTDYGEITRILTDCLSQMRYEIGTDG